MNNEFLQKADFLTFDFNNEIITDVQLENFIRTDQIENNHFNLSNSDEVLRALSSIIQVCGGEVYQEMVYEPMRFKVDTTIQTLDDAGYFKFTGIQDIYNTKSFTIDWGDGNISVYDDPSITVFSHTYSTPGQYSIEMSDKLIQFGDGSATAYPSNNITEINFGKNNSVSSISTKSLFQLTRLSSLVISDTVKSIGQFALVGCTKLSSVVIPNSVSSIGQGCFAENNTITGVYLPSNLEDINYQLFNNCTNLQYVEFPETLKQIGLQAFYNCKNLKNIDLPNSVLSIGSTAFLNVGGVNDDGSQKCEINFNGTCEELSNIASFDYRAWRLTTGTHISCLDGIYVVGSGFQKPIDLENSTILKFDTTNDKNVAFTVLQHPTPESGFGIDWGDGSYITTNVTGTNRYTHTYTTDGIKEVRITNSISQLGGSSDSEATTTNIVEITQMGDQISSIGANSFKNHNLSVLNIGEGVTHIHQTAFWANESTGNTTLSSIRFPNNIESIGTAAFEHQRALENVTFGSGLTSLNNWAFNDAPNLKTIEFNNITSNINNTDSKTFAGCTSVSSIDFNNCSNITVSQALFSGCSNVKEVNFNDCGNISLNGNAFKDRTSISSISLDGIVSFGDRVFENTRIQELVLPSSLSGSVGKRCFQNINTLTKITASCPVIGESMFDRCGNIQEIILNDGVTTINKWAFNGATQTTEIYIPNSVSSMTEAFSGCTQDLTLKIDHYKNGILDPNNNKWGATNATVIWLRENETILKVDTDISPTLSFYATVDEEKPIERFSIDFGNGVISSTPTSDSNGLYTYTYPEGTTGIQIVRISDNINNIGGSNSAYKSSNNLIALNKLNKNILSISYAFYDCSALTSISEFTNLSSINPYGLQYAFYNCVTLPEAKFTNLETVGAQGMALTFYNCQSLSSVDFSNLKDIKTQGMAYAFNDCSNLISIEFPNLSSIEDHGMYLTFSSCSKLSSVDFSSLENIESYGMYQTFYNCSSLISIEFPNLTSIQSNSFDSLTFAGCENLSAIYFRYDVKQEIESCEGYTEKFGATNATIHWIGAPEIIKGTTLLFDTDKSKTVSFYATVDENIPTEEFSIDFGDRVISSSPTTDVSGLYTYTYPEGTTGIQTVKISDNMKTFGGNSNSYKTSNNLVEIKSLGDNVLSITNTFYDCSSLSGIPVFDQESVGTWEMQAAFYNCDSLSSIEFPNLESVGDWGMAATFQDCSSLSSIEFSELSSVENYGMYGTFQRCSNLISAEFPKLENVKKYGMVQNFQVCQKLSSVEFPKLSSVGYHGLYYAFHYCTSLSSIEFPNLKSVGYKGLDGAFQDCSRLTEVKFPELTTLGTSSFNTMFQNCTQSNLSIYFRYDMKETIEAYSGYSEKWGATNATICWIGEPEIIDPEIVDGTTFLFDTDKSKIVSFYATLDEEQPIEDFLIDFGNGDISSTPTTDVSGLYSYTYPEGTTGIQTVKISDNMKTFGGNSFSYKTSKNLVEIKSLGDNVLSTKYAFYGCSALTSVPVFDQESVGNYRIQYAFQYCKSLSSVEFPNLLSVGNGGIAYAFTGCSKLISVEFPKLESIGDSGLRSAFTGCSSLISVEFPNLLSVSDDGMYGAFNGCSSLISAEFPNLISAGNDGMRCAFQYCSRLSSVEFPNLSSIGSRGMYSTFYKCSKLISTEFPELESIGDSGMAAIFSNCSKLSSIEFPKLESIGDSGMTGAFASCYKLSSIEFPNLNSIGLSGMYSVFGSCSNLSSAEFPNLISVGDYGMFYAFTGCSSLISVEFPKLESIGWYGMHWAFINCSSLTEVKFPELTSLGINVFGDFASRHAFLNCTQRNLSIHFRADIQATIEAQGGYTSKWGATNATILFDL